MVSFKTSNVVASSDQLGPARHLPVGLRSSLQFVQHQQQLHPDHPAHQLYQQLPYRPSSQQSQPPVHPHLLGYDPPRDLRDDSGRSCCSCNCPSPAPGAAAASAGAAEESGTDAGAPEADDGEEDQPETGPWQSRTLQHRQSPQSASSRSSRCCTTEPPAGHLLLLPQLGSSQNQRLEQPVTSSPNIMDSKKMVQTPAIGIPAIPAHQLQQLQHQQQQLQQQAQCPQAPPGAPSREQPQARSASGNCNASEPGSVGCAPISGVRRRSGPSQGLRSPAAKRPLSAPVALHGWLHKQGSEGLMLWKKRWFVLSEYCLFYYKGPEEEKQLGSILLPSYRVQVCQPEDKINKKFAFKAEHANMRTYYFAAETRDSMNQWVGALTLASLLQDPNPGGGGKSAIAGEAGQDGDRSARPSVSSISSALNQSTDDSDSGFHGFQSRDDPSSHTNSNNNSSPNSTNTSSFPGSNGNPSSIATSTATATNSHHPAIGRHKLQQQQHPLDPVPAMMLNGWNQHYRYSGQVLARQQQQPPPSSHSPLYQQQHLQTPQHKQYNPISPHHLASSPVSPGLQHHQHQAHHGPSPRHNFGQPVYANAPPKPRRLNDNSTEYSTPSPDLPESYRRSSPLASPSEQARLAAKSPMSLLDFGQRPHPAPASPATPVRTDKSGLNFGAQQQQQPAERRTPDTYARSAKPVAASGNFDYEDVYSTGPQLYQRPAGPVGYHKGPAPAPIHVPGQHQQELPAQPQYYVVSSTLSNGTSEMITTSIVRPQKLQPPRPHSADFLEYEATRRPSREQVLAEHEGAASPGQTKCPQRPKSSLDVVRPQREVVAGDNFFYSEERYAAQMRQSAVYVHQVPLTTQPRNPPSSKSANQQRDNESGIGTLSEMSCPSMRRSQRDYAHHSHTLHSSGHASDSIPSGCVSEALLRRSLRERGPTYQQQGQLDPSPGGYRLGREYECPPGGAGPSQRRWSEQQQDLVQQHSFARSASARLPRTARHPAAMGRPRGDADDEEEDDDDYAERSSGQDSRDGERKMQQREESMKRLLEWKQRMLQSPLTRKPSQAPGQSPQQRPDLAKSYKQQALLELAAHEASLAEARHSRRRDDHARAPGSALATSAAASTAAAGLGYHPPRSKSTDGRGRAGHPHQSSLPRYSSYSSDDEELGDVRRKRTRKPSSHTGRSPRSFEVDVPSVQLHHQHPSHQYPAAATASLQRQAPPPIPSTSSLDHHERTYIAPKPHNSNPQLSGTFRNQVQTQAVVQPFNTTSPNAIDTLDKKAPPKKLAGILKNATGNVSNNITPTSVNTKPDITESMNMIMGNVWTPQKNVQWGHGDPDYKFDESKVIKEFSYQYIFDGGVSSELESVNLVQSRIKSFEIAKEAKKINEVISEKEHKLTLQEPLKVSPQQSTEAHVSRLDPTKKPAEIIKEFALGKAENEYSQAKEHIREEEETLEEENSPDPANKSVKDLLADFERKSQQNQKEIEKSKDFLIPRPSSTDNETLVYETGRDDMTTPTIRSSAEDDDHDLGNITPETIQDELDPDDIQNIARADPDGTADPSGARLSVTESLVTHMDRFSEMERASPELKSEELNAENHYLPMTPRKSILDPNCDGKLPPRLLNNLFNNLREENSYVEMSRTNVSRSLLAPDFNGQDASQYEMVCIGNGKMEPVYMDVNQFSSELGISNIEKSCADMEAQKNQRSELPDILNTIRSDDSDADDESSKDLDSIDAPKHPRFSLSDTFRPASYYLGATQSLISELHDSSDSELVSPPPIPTSPPPLDDLDSLDTQDSLEIKKTCPQVSKSLSKSNEGDSDARGSFTDSRASLESASGSDSVELRNPEDEARYRRLKRRPVSDDVCDVLDSLDELEYLENRLDGSSIDLDQYLEELQARDAFNVDMYAKDLSYNSIYGLNENMLVAADKLYKPSYRVQSIKSPIIESTESLDKPYSYGSKSKTSSASSLPSMRVSEVPPVVNHQHSHSFTGDAPYENVRFSPLNVNLKTVKSDTEILPCQEARLNSTCSPVTTHSRDSSYSHGSTTIQRPPSSQSRSTSRNSLRYSQNSVTSTGRTSQMHSPVTPSNPSPSNYSQSHRRSSSQESSRNHDQSGAPYYYSDLQAASAQLEQQQQQLQQHQHPPIHHNQNRPRLSQLNNQRDDSGNMYKRNDIGRIVNPIPKQIPRQVQVEDIDEAKLIAAELRKTTQQLLAEDKVGLVDRRNFYEADTIRRVKSTEPLPDTSAVDTNARNLYPHGLKDKSDSPGHNSPTEFSGRTSDHRRSRSLEGLLDDNGLQNLVGMTVTQSAQPQEVAIRNPSRHENAREQTQRQPSSSSNYQSEDHWEQDSLWRENLRRVSLRHAKSLDNLDSDSRGPETLPRSRSKITRGATYVNDAVAQKLEERCRAKKRSESASTDRKVDRQPQNVDDDEDGTYERLAMDRIGAGGYVWDPAEGAYVKEPNRAASTGDESTQKNQSFLAIGNPVLATNQRSQSKESSRTSFELDREKLRQWDLLSSACLLQEQQRTSGAGEHSGRGLPASGPEHASGGAKATSSKTPAQPRKEPQHSNNELLHGKDQAGHQEPIARSTAQNNGPEPRTNSGFGRQDQHLKTEL